MITTKRISFAGIVFLFAFITVSVSSCKKDKAAAATTYQLQVKDKLGVSGTVTFTETSSTITTVDIALNGTDGVSHPAYIRNNSATETGSIALMLNPVVGGKSSTIVTSLTGGSLINYTQLTQFDGYLDVMQNDMDTTIIAQGDIGGNLITATNKTYTLDTASTLGVSGTALFEKRTNGKTLVTITLMGTLAGDVHPAAIHLGSVSTVGGGPIAITLNSVAGTTGKSYTNIRQLDNATPITYDNLLVYDGYLAVTQSAGQMDVILCKGNIGTH